MSNTQSKSASEPARSDATTAEPDPIFAAIQKHERAVEVFLQAVSNESRLQELLPDDRCQSSITAAERKIIETDDPRWIEAVEQRDKASESMDAAAMELLDQEPKTPEGAGAVLRYAIAHMDRYDGLMMGWPESLLPDGVDPDTASWSASRSSEYFLMQNVERCLERLSIVNQWGLARTTSQSADLKLRDAADVLRRIDEATEPYVGTGTDIPELSEQSKTEYRQAIEVLAKTEARSVEELLVKARVLASREAFGSDHSYDRDGERIAALLVRDLLRFFGQPVEA